MELSLEKYKGVIVPMVTPLDKKGKIDIISAEKLINFLLDNHTIPFVLGTTGEGGLIPVSEREVLIKILIENKRDGYPAIAGVIGLTFADTILQANKYFKLGVDSVVVTLPGYYELSDIQIYNYYNSLADNIDGDMIIYNIPKTVHQSIPVDIIEQLSYVDNIIGIKDSENNQKRLEYSLTLWKERKDFFHLTGVNALILKGLKQGSKGMIPSTGNIVPGLYIELYENYIKSDFQEADKIFNLSAKWSRLYQVDNTLGESLAALKFVMSEMDLCSPNMMLPLIEIGDEDKTSIYKEFKKLIAEDDRFLIN